MQIIFNTEHKVSEYSEPNSDLFPAGPARCPHTGCQAFIRQKSHGFYERNIISAGYIGKIYIRRYICPVCGKTVSMLPMFCLPHYQYSLAIIILSLYEYYCKQKNISKIHREQKTAYPSLRRRHIYLYIRRFIHNRQLIDYYIKNISPGSDIAGSQPEICRWAKGILDGIVKTPPSVFNIRFHQEIGKSFMARIKIIA
jgi:hypothetical protein